MSTKNPTMLDEIKRFISRRINQTFQLDELCEFLYLKKYLVMTDGEYYTNSVKTTLCRLKNEGFVDYKKFQDGITVLDKASTKK